jgi:hypothetical protein
VKADGVPAIVALHDVGSAGVCGTPASVSKEFAITVC